MRLRSVKIFGGETRGVGTIRSIEWEKEKGIDVSSARNFGNKRQGPEQINVDKVSRFDRSLRKRAVAFDYRMRDRAHPTIRHKVVNYAKCRLEMR